MNSIGCTASQERLAKLLSNSELIVAEKSGHMINFDQPSLVIEAIGHIVIASRGDYGATNS